MSAHAQLQKPLFLAVFPFFFSTFPSFTELDFGCFPLAPVVQSKGHSQTSFSFSVYALLLHTPTGSNIPVHIFSFSSFLSRVISKASWPRRRQGQTLLFYGMVPCYSVSLLHHSHPPPSPPAWPSQGTRIAVSIIKNMHRGSSHLKSPPPCRGLYLYSCLQPPPLPPKTTLNHLRNSGRRPLRCACAPRLTRRSSRLTVFFFPARLKSFFPLSHFSVVFT